MSGRGNDEVMTVFPMRMTVEHPDVCESVVEPSVKAMKWLREGWSGMKGGKESGSGRVS